MGSPRVSAFLQQLSESQLLEPAQLLEAQRHPLARGDDPTPLAKELVRRGWVTAFQAAQVLTGRAKDLTLGPYRLQDRLGEGGMGQVFRAYHAPMDRVVALKVIRREKLGSALAVQRFLKEIRAAAQLTHPNIVTAFDAGQAGDTHFFAMEYVEGVNLLRLVKESGPLPVGTACEYIRQAASGLDHAHERGLVHRDIKPSNLLVTGRSGKGEGTKTAAQQIKILDMGLARLQGPDDNGNGLTRVGAIVGTPGYLAPEQAVNAHGVDSRADIYSLGSTLYFLLAGQAPFSGDSVNDVLLNQQSKDPPPLSTLRADVPAGVQAILTKMLAKRPDDRFQTAAEVAEVLQPFVRLKTTSKALTIPTLLKSAGPLTAFGGRAMIVPSFSLGRHGRPGWRWVVAAALALLLTGSLLLAGLLYAALGSKPTDRSSAIAHAPIGTPLRKAETKAERPTTRLPDSQPGSSNPTGTWKWTVAVGGSRDMTLKLRLDGDRLSGAIVWREGREIPIEDARYQDGTVSFRFTRERKGQRFVTTYQGKVSGDTIKGTSAFDFGGQAQQRDWEARRVTE